MLPSSNGEDMIAKKLSAGLKLAVLSLVLGAVYSQVPQAVGNDREAAHFALCRQHCTFKDDYGNHCVGICKQVLDALGGHAGYKHSCHAGHEW
jgi:hypothetical protein